MLTALHQTSDARLVKRVLSGRTDDYQHLVERYINSVRAIARSRLLNPAYTDDVTQESFLTAYQKLDTLQTPKHFGPWLMAIARNTAISLTRRQRREVPLEGEVPEMAVDAGARLEEREMAQALHQTLAELPEAPRELILLHYYAGNSLREIAGLLNISRDAAAKRLQRARETLGAAFLKSIGEEAPQRGGVESQTKAVMGAIAAAPAAWQASAASAAVGGTVALSAGGTSILSAKLAGVAVLLAALLSGASLLGFLSAQDGGEELRVQAASAAATPENGTGVLEEATPDNESARGGPEEEAPAIDLTETGPGEVTVLLVSIFGGPVKNTEVVLERVTWALEEIPPAVTFKRKAITNDKGEVVFSDLPLGRYSGGVFNEKIGGLDPAILTESRLKVERTTEVFSVVPFRGKVVNAQGEPVHPAVLYPTWHSLIPKREYGYERTALARAETKPDGSFSLPFWPGSMKFLVTAPGSPTFVSEEIKVPNDDATIVVGRAGQIRGRIVAEESGEPISGATVKFRGDSSISQERVVGRDGVFVLEKAAPGSYELRLDDPVMVLSQAAPTAQVAVGKTTDLGDITVITGAVIMGRVYDKETGQGVPDTELRLMCRSGGYPSRRSQSGATGDFIFSGLPRGSVGVFCIGDVEGYAARNTQSHSVSVEPGVVYEGVDIALSPGIMLSGKVIGEHGNPVSGAEVRAFTIGMPHATGKKVSGPDGSFCYTEFLDGSTVVLSARHDGWSSETQVLVLSAEGLRDQVLELTLLATGRIEGRIEDPSGDFASILSMNLGVTARRVGNPMPAIDPLDVSPGGQFVFEDLTAGTYELGVHDRQSMNEQSRGHSVTVELDKGATVKDVVLTWGEAGLGIVSGRVLGPDGKPLVVAWLRVQKSGRRASTNATGFFTLKDLPGGPHVLEVTAPAMTPKRVENVYTGTKNLLVRLEGPARLAGRVVDAGTGAPVKDFEIRCTHPALDTLSGPLHHQSAHVVSEDGAFEMTGLRATTAEISVVAGGYHKHAERIEKLDSRRVNRVTIKMARGGVVEGFVSGPRGEALAGVSVYKDRMPARQPGRHEFPEKPLVTTNREGHYRIDTLEPGRVTPLFFLHPNHPAASATVTPRANVSQRRDVSLPPAGALRITVLWNGRPASHFSYNIMDTTTHQNTVFGLCESTDGVCLVENLAEGQATVRIQTRQDSSMPGVCVLGGRGQQDVTIVTGAVAEASFALDSGSAELEGRITMHGEPLGQGHLLIHAADPELLDVGTYVQLAKDGSYRIQGLSAGEYNVVFVAQLSPESNRVAEIAITLAGGEAKRLDHDFSGSATIEGAVHGFTPGIPAGVTVYEGHLVVEGTWRDTRAAHHAQIRAGAQVSEAGFFQIPHLPAGDYTAICIQNVPEASEDGPPAFQHVTVADGETVTIELVPLE